MLKLGTLMENDHYIMILLFITIQCNTYCHLTTILHKRKKDKDNLINPKTYIFEMIQFQSNNLIIDVYILIFISVQFHVESLTTKTPS